MYTRHMIKVAAIVSTVAATAFIPLSSAGAQDPPCKQLGEAMLKQMTRPFHAYSTEVAGFNNNSRSSWR